MVDSRQKVFRLPRHLLAVIANDNPQAIKALENLEVEIHQTLPERLELLQQAVESLDDSLQSAVMVAYQALAVASNAQSDGYLPMVAVGGDVGCGWLPVV